MRGVWKKLEHVQPTQSFCGRMSNEDGLKQRLKHEKINWEKMRNKPSHSAKTFWNCEFLPNFQKSKECIYICTLEKCLGKSGKFWREENISTFLVVFKFKKEKSNPLEISKHGQRMYFRVA